MCRLWYLIGIHKNVSELVVENPTYAKRACNHGAHDIVFLNVSPKRVQYRLKEDEFVTLNSIRSEEELVLRQPRTYSALFAVPYTKGKVCDWPLTSTLLWIKRK